MSTNFDNAQADFLDPDNGLIQDEYIKNETLLKHLSMYQKGKCECGECSWDGENEPETGASSYGWYYENSDCAVEVKRFCPTCNSYLLPNAVAIPQDKLHEVFSELIKEISFY